MGEGAPFRPAAARLEERVAWPAEWGCRFLVFVDVEEEFDWRLPLDRAARATTAMAALPDAHRRFAAAGTGIACMVDHPVATDPASADILRGIAADPRSAIGAQLHAWVTPPHDEPLNPVNSYPGNLPPALEAAKIDALTAAIEAASGTRPIAYRAGRYGIGPATLRLLAERGYRIDSSMRSRYDYSADGGPDFAEIGADAFIRQGVIELPLTTIFTGIGRRWGPRLSRILGALPRGPGAAARVGLLSRVALTPEDMPVAAALEAVDAAVDDGLGLFGFSFHSPSLVPGHTPYVRDASDLAEFWGWWDKVLGRLEARGVRATTLPEVLRAAIR